MIRPGALDPGQGHVEIPIRRDRWLALGGAVALIPALVLVATGLAGLDRPDLLVHPAFVIGGIAIAVGCGLVAATHWEARQDREGLRFSCTIRPRAANLVVLATGLGLLAIILAYVFLENFQPRLLQ